MGEGWQGWKTLHLPFEIRSCEGVSHIIFPKYGSQVRRLQTPENISHLSAPRLGPLIDRGFAVVNAGSHTIRDTHSFPRLCVVQLQMVQSEQVRLSSPDAQSPLLFSLPSDFQAEPESRFVSTSIIGGACSSVWDCGEEAAGWISRTLSKKESGLRLVYHYSQVSLRSHSPQVREREREGNNTNTITIAVLEAIWRHHESHGLASSEQCCTLSPGH